ncbi:hypothetical protein [Victivallis lenta]|nr:hypothetical protein [Victivallis lenta]
MNGEKNGSCPCSNAGCARHGDCAACQAHHHSKGGRTSCGK